VYSGLYALLIGIIGALSRAEEFWGFHAVLLIFFIGLIFTFQIHYSKSFSHIRTIFIILANISITFAPVFIFIYLHEYLRFWKLDYEYCEKHKIICEEHRIMMETIGWICLWGGVFLYLTIGSQIFKSTYKKIIALPKKK
jgi:hypothetical protein